MYLVPASVVVFGARGGICDLVVARRGAKGLEHDHIHFESGGIHIGADAGAVDVVDLGPASLAAVLMRYACWVRQLEVQKSVTSSGPWGNAGSSFSGRQNLLLFL